ncbi:putative ribosomally synthesized peptide with SipW-like signal peptide [Arthrobacter ulcerisalmonis]|nr:SipW-dependent-type signal peptide-containing protein [Arthrobacter ulcerisalmonis]MDQ0663208.1 putative ribosomally synthesized peptide with SipW-like signal peptide [Arthrobacter ulcerisalmonis]
METVKTSRWTKGRAILAGGLVLGVGAAATLAAWTDNEWVFGGSGNGDGTGPNTPGTGVYRMQQNTWAGDSGAEKWTDEKDANGGALTFSVDPGKLVPGKTVYSPMQLRTVAGSEALNVSLAEGIQSVLDQGTKNSPALYAALTYGVFKGVGKAACAAGTVNGGSVVVPAGSPLTAVSPTTFPLAAGANASTPGDPENLCFALTLPSTASVDLQGLNTVPVWRFTSSVGQ